MEGKALTLLVFGDHEMPTCNMGLPRKGFGHGHRAWRRQTLNRRLLCSQNPPCRARCWHIGTLVSQTFGTAPAGEDTAAVAKRWRGLLSLPEQDNQKAESLHPATTYRIVQEHRLPPKLGSVVQYRMLTFARFLKTAKQRIADAGHQSKALALRRCGESFFIVRQAGILAAAEHAICFAAPGVAVCEARAIEALRKPEIAQQTQAL